MTAGQALGYALGALLAGCGVITGLVITGLVITGLVILGSAAVDAARAACRRGPS
ncbi:MAG TPA: hypothetical protein VH478_04265 [Trebonia sp.]|nr:hypothetical protein [Trebonia sp.]